MLLVSIKIIWNSASDIFKSVIFRLMLKHFTNKVMRIRVTRYVFDWSNLLLNLDLHYDLCVFLARFYQVSSSQVFIFLFVLLLFPNAVLQLICLPSGLSTNLLNNLSLCTSSGSNLVKQTKFWQVFWFFKCKYSGLIFWVNFNSFPYLLKSLRTFHNF